MSELDTRNHISFTVPAQPDRLPMSGLLALAAAGFITILTEALPAGLLRQMSADLAVSDALVGQLVTLYAMGSLLAAIPLVSATRSWRRRPLLLAGIAGFIVVNTITAISANYTLTLAARFVAGVSAGVVWSLLAGYAGRMAPEHLKGRAIAIAMVGTPLALSLGIPLGTMLGATVGWRYTFGGISVLALLLVGWVWWKVPDFEGQPASRRARLATVLASPGLKRVLGAMLAFVLAHNILYTYIAPFLALAHLENRVDAILFVFGVTALIGIGIVGALVDRRLRQLVLLSVVLFALAVVALGSASSVPAVIYLGVGAWGLAFGGAATLFQTASANASGAAADLAQAMVVTVWNVAIAAGGALGGIAIESYGAGALPWASAALLALAFLVVCFASRSGFPSTTQTC
ncbi:MFS transporter [Caballeronia mineralivorans PML1(12)]|uniref:MFS transporter n=2 Tax=Caballeronia mineralivorans TaxID=2010198 RepID=A0A0J1CU19_9BURK|nr:MFS transporter [Caballeronia mineralivorans PML1(12)]